MITAFADRAFGLACWMDNGGGGAASFASAVRLGEVVTCRVDVVRKAKALYFPQGSQMIGDRVVAIAKGVCKIVGAA